MRYAIHQSVQWSVIFGGAALTLIVAGVRLHIDRYLEDCYIEVEPEFDREALEAIGGLADALGFEVMPRWECPPQEMPSGALRHWLAEKEVVHDSSSVQAV